MLHNKGSKLKDPGNIQNYVIHKLPCSREQ